MNASRPPETTSPQSWSSAESHAFDYYLQSCGIPAACLMEQAARSITNFLEKAIPTGAKLGVIFLCGPGNNGADALASARQLLDHPELRPQVLLPGGTPPRGSLLEMQKSAFEKLGGQITETDSASLLELPNRPTILVDGLFGVGLSRAIRSPYAEVIQAAQASEIPILAVDCPSGLCCDTGHLLGPCATAHWTITFIGMKQGFQTNVGKKVCGEVHVANIGVRSELAEHWLQKYRKGQVQA